MSYGNLKNGSLAALSVGQQLGRQLKQQNNKKKDLFSNDNIVWSFQILFSSRFHPFLGTKMLGNYSVSTERHGGMIHRELRRQSDSLRAQHLWDAIRAVRQQKQVPAIQRMSRYMNRFYGISKEQTQTLLDLAVQDNLIKLENKIGTKGTKSGVEEKAYRWPTLDMLPRERHDWYCFHCHTGGEVVLCGDCHRVYHEACLKEPLKLGVHTDDFLCHYCRTFQAIQGGYENGTNKRERKDLNHLLSLTCKKLRSKMPANLLFRERPELKAQEAKDDLLKVDGTPPPPPPGCGGSTPSTPAFDGTRKLDENDDSWRVNFLLKEMMDFDEIAKKCSTNQYRIVDEFRADCQLIVHNVVIYHGGSRDFDFYSILFNFSIFLGKLQID